LAFNHPGHHPAGVMTNQPPNNQLIV
jgi:hypothetical protein